MRIEVIFGKGFHGSLIIIDLVTALAKKSRNKVRIIAGSLRGRLIGFPDEPGLRPTGDRLRETLFSWLQPTLPGSRCLDMFAGSGALGFEALSRGASQVVMLEKSRKVHGELRNNIDLLGIDNIQLDCVDATSVDVITGFRPVNGNSTSGGFNIVFIDPPFADQIHQKALDCLVAANVLADDALVTLESSKRDVSVNVPAYWHIEKEKFAGEVCLRLYRVMQK